MGMVSVGKAVFVDQLNCACVGGKRTPLGSELRLIMLMGLGVDPVRD